MDRWDRVRMGFAQYKISALVATSRVNIRYLTGFTGTFGLAVITDESVHLFTDGRYASRAQEEIFPEVKLHVVMPSHQVWEALLDILPVGIRVGLESWNLSVEQWARIHTLFRKKDLQRVRIGSFLEYVRSLKTSEEVGWMRQAQRLVEQVLDELFGEFQPGKTTEWEFAVELQYRLKRKGADDVSFEPIIASGPNSAIPHARSRPVPIQPNQVLLVDVGAIYQGYCSDMTRTFWVGPDRPSLEFKQVYQTVLSAQQEALRVIRDGVKADVPDQHARKVLKGQNLESYYTHGLGHGVGLEIHEYPALSIFHSNAPTLEKGMVVTVEPGVYLADSFGVRIEDMVWIQKEGVENLTGFPKDLQVI